MLKNLDKKQCIEFYTTSLDYLVKIAEIRSVNKDELKRYFTPNHCVDEMNRIFSTKFKDENDIRFILCRLFYSMQNTGYKNFVKLNEHATIYRDLLCEFDPKAFIEKYPKKKPFLGDAMSNEKILGISKNNKKAFSSFFDGVYDATMLISNFDSAPDFLSKVVSENSDDPATDIIKYLLDKSRKPTGLGEAVSYDFIKETGLADCGKPDVHILDVLEGVGLISEKRILADANEALREIAKANSITVYKLDKIIWLICTKNFYLHDSGDERQNYIAMLNKAIAK